MDKDLIKKIVAATGIITGELVLVQFWGEGEDAHIMHAAADAVAALGASPVEIIQSRRVNAQRFLVANEKAFDGKYFQHLSNFDAVIDIFTYRPVVLETLPDSFRMDLYEKYMSNLFSALSEVKRFSQIRIPTEENAKESNLNFEDYSKRMLAAMDVDYNALREVCRAAADGLQERTEVTLVTGDGHKLNFQLEGRKWYVDAGDGDIPAGEIYIAPLEDKTNGKVFFDKLFAGCWGEFADIVLTIENGVITASSGNVLAGHLAQLDDARKTICELGLGKNPNITGLCGFTVLDEKAHGTFHIGIGNNIMFGGKNSPPFHMDFVGGKGWKIL
ncbi:MAG: aminopeptidase [Defluviitaleaceae bacterium]|nr:aminopeptidase [Defluviitaleaceae bacterium]